MRERSRADLWARDAGPVSSRGTRECARILSAACALVLGLLVSRAAAQTVRSDFYITNGQVTTQVLRGNTLYVGGSFSYVGPVTGSGVPVNLATATPAADFPRVNGTVMAAVSDGSGGWFIGGQFTAVGAESRTNLAHILADQSVAAWNPGTGSIVRTLVLRSGVLYVGGDFLTLGGLTRNRVGAVDANTGVTTSWNPNANSSVRAFVETPTQLLVGGQFTTIGGQARNRIARLNFTTGVADAWNPNANSVVSALAYDAGANLVYAGGQFTLMSGLTRNRVAAIDGTTGGATSWDPNANNQVLSLLVSGSEVYAGGQFTLIGGQSRSRLAALSTSTGLATSWNPNAGNFVQALVLSGSTLYAGGDFLTMGGQSRSRIAAVDVTTGVPTSWNPSAFSTVTVLTLGTGEVFVGGSFNGIGGTERNNLAAFDVTTGQVTGWNPNANNQVQALAASEDLLYAGGNFTQVGGQIRNNLAALDLTNGLATAWDPNSDGQVSALVLAGDRLYTGGLFTQVGGLPRTNLAALALNDGHALPFTANADDQVFTIATGGTTVYAGGNFTTVNGTARNFVAAMDSASGAVTSWNPDPTGTVRAIVTTCDRIYLGGFFTSIVGQARNRLATVNLTTGAPLAWDPDANGPVFVLEYAPGTVYVGGVLSAVGGQLRNRIASVDPQTAAVTAWNPNSNGTVRSIVTQGSEVFLSGAFSSMAATPTGNLAVVSSDPAASCPEITLTAPPLTAGVQGTAYTTTVTASGGTGSYCYAVSAGALPSGLTLNRSTGQISGTPTATGIALFSVTATDLRGCPGTASYTISVTAAPAQNTLAANGAGLCLNPAQACVGVPFTLVRGDAVGLRALSITLQLETAKLQLCAPGSPASNFHLGTWGASFNNRSIQVTSLGSGRYTVDVVLLGGACGETAGGLVFTADVAAVGPTGSGALTVVSVVARDCANGPVAAVPGPAGSVSISSSAITLAPTTLPSGSPGTPYSQTITASGASGPVTFTISAGALPPGLALSTSGLLSGTPTTGGTFNFTVRASESGGCSGSRAYTLSTTCASIAVSPAYLPDGAVGSAYAATVFASNTIAPATFSVTAGALPAGLALAANGEITGTPTTAGPATFTIGVVDAAGCSGARAYAVDIFATPPVSSVAANTTGLAISSAHPCVHVPIVYTRGESTPARGLTVSLQIDPTKLALCSTVDSSFALGSWFSGFGNTQLAVTNDGGGAYSVDVTLLGSPCGITTGGTLFTIALAANGPDGKGAITVTRVKSRDCSNVAIPVLAGPPDSLRIQNTDLVLAPTNLPNGSVGAPYSQAITASPGLAPYTFTIASGSLPAGLSLSTSGLLSGTPTATGSANFTVAVTDAGGVPGSRAYTLNVTCPPIAVTPGTLPDGQVGVAYAQSLFASGGTAPYAFTITVGALPDGLSLASTGELTGTPTTASATAFTVHATDAFGCTGEETYTLPVFTDPAISRVVPVTAGLCLSSTQTCVNVPFVYQRGDSAAAGAAHVTFQLDSRFALCTPGNPSASIHAGSWLAGYTNKTLQIINHGGGSYSVDQALLGTPCGPTTGGVLFTVDVAAVGGDGAGDITVTDVRIRDCANVPLPGQPGPAAQLIVSTATPPKITSLATAQILTGNSTSGSLTRITVTWSLPVPGTVALYRAPFGSYPEYDDNGGTLPDSTLAPNAPWLLVSANATSGLLDVPPGRGSWHYVAFLTDSCGNRSLVSNVSKGSLDYHLGDVSNGLVRGTGDNRVRVEDVSLLGAHYGISGATLVSDSVAYLDVGPTVNGLVTGRPSTDNLIDFEDLMVFASNFMVVSAPQSGAKPAPPANGGTGESFTLEAPSLVTQGEEFDAVLELSASGAMQGFSAQLAWDSGVLQPLSVASAGLLESQGGVVFSPKPGVADAALLGLRGVGIQGLGRVATFRFRALRDGDGRLRIAKIIARDPANHRLQPGDLAQSLTTALPAHTVLLAPSPNPAQGEANLAYALSEAGPADLSIYAVDGRRVRNLAHGPREPGSYRITWRGDDDAGHSVAPGVYWARLQAAGRTWNRRVVFLR